MSSLPQHCPPPGVLDDLELIALGAAALRPFDAPGSPFSLALPPAVAEAAREAGGVQLVDPEGLVVAYARPDGSAWTVELGAAPDYGPFRRLRRPAGDVRAAQEDSGDAVVVPVEAPLSAAQHADLAGATGPVVLLVLAGHGWADVPATDLVRGALAATRDLAHVDVVVAPLARRGDPAADAALRAEVVGAYGTVVELPRGDGSLAAGATPPAREQGLVVLFTGLSGSGKSTLARALVDELLETTDRSVTSLDGDVVRRNLSAGLSFSPADRETNIRRIGWVAAEVARHGGVAICSPIAPYDATRQDVRRMAAEAGAQFVLVHVATPVEECERRDRKGLYAKARAGEIPDFTGISAPYETPADADVVVDTTGRSVADALAPVLRALGMDRCRPTAEVAPAPLAVELASPSAAPLKVLVVCTANICRSPYMELALRAAAGDAVVVSGAGTHGFRDHAMDDLMAAEARERGLDPTGFSSRAVTRELIADADLVLTAESRHRTFLLEEHPAAFKKVFTLGQFARGVQQVGEVATPRELIALIGRNRPSAEGVDVADPYRRGPEAAAACARHIDELVGVVGPALRE
ncbi:adenylyl-sulfate kinase [Nocardioides zeae]|uniref:adenylyl-sulfate kinase n=1 Tax=Nocardioides imazamoxiresistens TaxID=3231893 RepID=A0ABU3PWE3_9ACTN|nr:adenylyl-sulfate kinase [Nocardioides zeae]MDT9593555.1 adenylyl-sulfate kinase [Nocardioides zeae]